MKSMLYGNYVVYQYEMDSEDHKTDKFFAIAIVLSEYLAEELCNDNDMRFYEEEEINIGEDFGSSARLYDLHKKMSESNKEPK